MSADLRKGTFRQKYTPRGLLAKFSLLCHKSAFVTILLVNFYTPVVTVVDGVIVQTDHGPHCAVSHLGSLF